MWDVKSRDAGTERNFDLQSGQMWTPSHALSVNAALFPG